MTTGGWRPLRVGLCGGALFLAGAAVARAQGAPGAIAVRAGEHATRDRYLLIAASAVGSASFTQAAAMPAEWPRTWRGYGARLGDQAGFAIAEESLRLLLLEAAPWEGGAPACRGARKGRAWLARAAGAARCGIANTLVVRNAEGARRPNVPFLGAVIGSSALSLAWRPERSSASKGRAFVLTRIGVVTGAAMTKGAYGYLR